MSLRDDLRFGFRMLLKQPGLTGIAVLALALGIGLTTIMFSIVNGALIRGLPFEESERIVAISGTNVAENQNRLSVSIHDFTDYREAQRSIESLGAMYAGTVNVSSEGKPERFDGAFVTANTFDVTRVRPILGRGFVQGDDAPGAPMTIVLGHGPWQRRFGGDPNIVGKVLRVNGRPATVIGVMPEKYGFPSAQEVWVPMQLDPLTLKRGEGQVVVPFGRLKPGVTIEQAQAEIGAIAKRLAEQYPQTNKDLGATVQPFVRRFLGSQTFTLLYTMLGTVFGVLLVACANVANVLLARTAARTKEVAVRTALGATRGRVVRQLMVETLMIAIVGAALGLAIAQAGIVLFNRAIVDTNPPFWIDIRIDLMVLLFVSGLTIVSALASGVAPALKAARADVNEILKDESRGSSGMRVGRLSRGLVVAEIALSFGLLVAAGLMIKTIVNVQTFDFGFSMSDVLTARMGLFESRYPDDASRARFYAEVQRRLEALPGARSATLTTNLPGLGSGSGPIGIQGRTYAADRDYPSAHQTSIAPRYFETFGVAVLKGRDFTSSDDASAPRVAIVNRSFADSLFKGEEPIGRQFREGRSDSKNPWLTIVGVAPDLYMDGPENEHPAGYYVPVAQGGIRFMSLAVRATGDPLALSSVVRDQVAAVDPDMPIYFVRTLRDSVYQGAWPFRVFGALFMAFGVSALFLATVGLYGVMAFSVRQRTQEIGLRMALGAAGTAVMGMFVRQGLWQIGIGLVLGVGLGAGLARLMTAMLFRVQPWDLMVFTTIAIVLATAALVACLIPARRAMRVDPLIALRYE
jgi:predicted permease